jgi:hypothetical protein
MMFAVWRTKPTPVSENIRYDMILFSLKRSMMLTIVAAK